MKPVDEPASRELSRSLSRAVEEQAPEFVGRLLKSNPELWGIYHSDELFSKFPLIYRACREQLVDRADRPWDNPERRPSHADRRRQIAKKMLRNEFMNDLDPGPDDAKIRDRFERLLSLAA